MSFHSSRPLFLLSLLFLASACVKKPPSDGGVPFDGAGWFVIDDANDAVSGIDLSDFRAYDNVLPEANSPIVSDIAFLPGLDRAYVAGGYFSGQGDSDIKAVDLASGEIVADISIGAGKTVNSGAFAASAGAVYAASYSSAGTGRYLRFGSSLTLQKDVFLGGLPQALTVKDGNVYIANTDSYSYVTNWIDCLTAGNGPSVRLEIASDNPISLAVSSDGLSLYVLCGGNFMANDGAVVVITNPALPSRGIKGTGSLGFNTFGKIVNANDRIFFTSSDGVWEFFPGSLTVSRVALAGTDLNDIDTDGTYLYLTPGWGGTVCRILDASTLAPVRTITVDGGGMGALYAP